MIPYGRQSIDDHDVAAVVAAMRSDRLTQGPRVEELEEVLARLAAAELELGLVSHLLEAFGPQAVRRAVAGAG